METRYQLLALPLHPLRRRHPPDRCATTHRREFGIAAERTVEATERAPEKYGRVTRCHLAHRAGRFVSPLVFVAPPGVSVRVELSGGAPRRLVIEHEVAAVEHPPDMVCGAAIL